MPTQVEDLGAIARRMRLAGVRRPFHHAIAEWERQCREAQRERETWILENLPDSELALSIKDHREAGNYLRG